MLLHFSIGEGEALPQYLFVGVIYNQTSPIWFVGWQANMPMLCNIVIPVAPQIVIPVAFRDINILIF